MKLSQLKQQVQNYDNRKGWRRRLLGDATQITVLKKFIEYQEANLLPANRDPDLTLQDYQQFAVRNHYSLDLSNHYIHSGSASACIFQSWQLHDTVQQHVDHSLAELRNRLNTIQINPAMARLHGDNLIPDRYLEPPRLNIPEHLIQPEELPRLQLVNQHLFFPQPHHLAAVFHQQTSPSEGYEEENNYDPNGAAPAA